MNIEKLPSGSYRIRQTYKGKRYTVTVPYKPSKRDAIDLMSEAMKDVDKNKDIMHMTFSEAYTDYLEIKSNILSPSTKRGYKTIYKAVPDGLKKQLINEITSIDIQKTINDYSCNHSPKSTKNYYSFISTIIKTFSNRTFKIKLPQEEKSDPYIPTIEEVKMIMDEMKGTKYYIPTSLACLGLRLSEICALTIDDLNDDNQLIINKAKVKDDNNNYIIKTTKTTDSTRMIFVPQDIADMIREQGYVYRGSPNFVYKNLISVENRLGIQHFSLHKLRHFFASYAHNELHLSEKQIMSAGGWATRSVMDTVYTHTMKQDEANKKIANEMGKLF